MVFQILTKIFDSGNLSGFFSHQNFIFLTAKITRSLCPNTEYKHAFLKTTL